MSRCLYIALNRHVNSFCFSLSLSFFSHSFLSPSNSQIDLDHLHVLPARTLSLILSLFLSFSVFLYFSISLYLSLLIFFFPFCLIILVIEWDVAFEWASIGVLCMFSRYLRRLSIDIKFKVFFSIRSFNPSLVENSSNVLLVSSTSTLSLLISSHLISLFFSYLNLFISILSLRTFVVMHRIVSTPSYATKYYLHSLLHISILLNTLARNYSSISHNKHIIIIIHITLSVEFEDRSSFRIFRKHLSALSDLPQQVSLRV